MPAFIVAGPFDVPLQPGVKKAKLINRAAAKSLVLARAMASCGGAAMCSKSGREKMAARSHEN